MAEKKYRIKLSEEERKELKAVVASKAAVSKRHRAQILLCADENHKEGGMKDRDIVNVTHSAFDVSWRVWWEMLYWQTWSGSALWPRLLALGWGSPSRTSWASE